MFRAMLPDALSRSVIMKIFVVTEPGDDDRVNINAIAEGIRAEAAKKRYELVFLMREELEPGNIDIVYGGIDKRILIILGTSIVWIEETLRLIENQDIHAVLVNNTPMETADNISVVHNNHTLATKAMLEYLVGNGRGRLALFGVSRSSHADILKEDMMRSVLGIAHVYYRDVSVSECYCGFAKDADRYNGIICTNDIVAAYLMKRLLDAGCRIPEDYAVVSFGDSVLAEMMSPSLTTVRLNYSEMGRQAVLLYVSLFRNPDNVSVVTSINCDIVERESTRGIAVDRGVRLPEAHKYNGKKRSGSFIDDPDIRRIMRIEDALAGCKEIDLEILRGLIGKRRMAELSDELFISESTLKYRIKQLLLRFGCGSRQELAETLGEYVRQ